MRPLPVGSARACPFEDLQLVTSPLLIYTARLGERGYAFCPTYRGRGTCVPCRRYHVFTTLGLETASRGAMSGDAHVLTVNVDKALNVVYVQVD